MDPLSKKLSLVRYGVVVAAMCLVLCGYRIATTGLGGGSLVAVGMLALISLKYPFSDMIVRMVRRRWPKLKALPWLWIGYGAAVVVDVAATWVAISDTTDANFALIWTIFGSPWLLAAAFLAMVLHTLVARKR